MVSRLPPDLRTDAKSLEVRAIESSEVERPSTLLGIDVSDDDLGTGNFSYLYFSIEVLREIELAIEAISLGRSRSQICG